MRLTIAAVLTALVGSSALAEEPKGLRMLEGLVGSWRGTSDGEPGQGKVERDCGWILRERFLQCTNCTTYAPREKNPKGEVHEDVAIFSYDKGRNVLRLRQFHAEGFVNEYAATVSEPGARFVFASEAIENIPDGWRARESYELNGDSWVETFELASPGGELKVYSRAKLGKVN